jgi:hypothetical protein
MAGDVAVELALIADADIDGSELPADTQSGKEGPALLRRRHDIEVAIIVAIEEGADGRTLVAEPVTVTKVHLRNHAA